jgi:hypothetical protein
MIRYVNVLKNLWWSLLDIKGQGTKSIEFLSKNEK